MHQLFHVKDMEAFTTKRVLCLIHGLNYTSISSIFLKIQIILILYSTQKRDKNITVNTSTADVVYSNSTIKL